MTAVLSASADHASLPPHMDSDAKLERLLGGGEICACAYFRSALRGLNLL